MTPIDFTQSLDRMHMVGDHYEMTFRDAADIVGEMAEQAKAAAEGIIPAKPVASVGRRREAVA